MKNISIAAMPYDIPSAQRLATEMNVEFAPIELRDFPDGETLVRASEAARTTILYCSLNDPNEKLAPLVLAVSALRDLGAEEIILVAPYLCYMRQDKAFHRGEAVSQRVIAKLLSPWIDQLVTVEPHLHRVKDLGSVFPDIKSISLSGALLLAELINRDGAKENMLLVGPDQEAGAWTKAVAERAQLPYVILTKKRLGDRDVSITLPKEVAVRGKHVCLIDDVISTGATLASAAMLLREQGAAMIEALTVHALCSSEGLKQLKAASVARLRSTDTVCHETNAISIAPMLAGAIVQELGR
jgi:ribose-phosphate pyrophosphokinase